MKTTITLALLLASWESRALPAGTKGEDGHFKISDKAAAHMGIRFERLVGPGPWQIPKEAIVKVRLTEGVYRRIDGEITFVIVKKANASITSSDLEAGDEVAVAGAPFLRMAETDLNSETVDACAH